MRWCGAVVALVAGLLCGAAGASSRLGPPSHVLVDADSGRVLARKRASAGHVPGALSNLMVVLLTLEQAALGSLPLDVPVAVSERATARLPHGATEEDRQPVALRGDRAYVLGDLLRVTLVTSSGDTAVAVAEAVAGSVPECLRSMNARAQRLGMSSTSFASIGGVRPVPGGTDRTTARDMARLARSLLRHAETLRWASLGGMPFDGGRVALRNVNELLGVVAGADGLHVTSDPARGFGIVATAKRRGLRLIAVVLGAESSQARYRAAADLLEWGFARYERVDVVREGEVLNLGLTGRDDGEASSLVAVAGAGVSLLRRRGEEQDLRIRYQLPPVVPAELEGGAMLGELIVEEKGKLVAVVPVLAAAASTGEAKPSATVE